MRIIRKSETLVWKSIWNASEDSSGFSKLKIRSALGTWTRQVSPPPMYTHNLSTSQDILEWLSRQHCSLYIATECWSGTTTPIRHIAVLETSISRHHGDGGPMEGPLKSSVHHNTIILRDLRGTSIDPPLCQKTLVSRTAIYLINAVFSSQGRRVCPFQMEHPPTPTTTISIVCCTQRVFL